MFQQETLLGQLGDAATNRVVERFKKFAYVRDEVIDSLADGSMAMEELWGANNYVLHHYLAVVVPWSIEQGRYTFSGNQFYVTAGHLRTRYGSPIYLVFQPNENPGRQPWYLETARSSIRAPRLPQPPEIPIGADIPRGAEIVIRHDHILDEHPDRLPFLVDTPRVAQLCAIAGAIQWSINRGLQFSYWYYGMMQHLVPLYLQTREDITAAPDAVAPIEVIGDELHVRTILEPHMPYARARVAVSRHDQLPAWLLDAWKDWAERMSEDQIEDPEGELS